MTALQPDTVQGAPAARPHRRALWPLWAVPAGVLGSVTLLIVPRPQASIDDRHHTVTPADMAGLPPGTYHLGVVCGFLSVVCLLVLAAQWRRHVEARFDWSAAAPVVSGGFVATAGGLTFAAGWMGALSRYVDSGPEHTAFDEQGVYTYFVLVDFGPYLVWLGALVAAGALGWMAWRERLVSRVLGTGAGLLSVGVLGAVLVTGVPGLVGLAALALPIAGVWLTLGHSVITKPDDQG